MYIYTHTCVHARQSPSQFTRINKGNPKWGLSRESAWKQAHFLGIGYKEGQTEEGRGRGGMGGGTESKIFARSVYK